MIASDCVRHRLASRGAQLFLLFWLVLAPPLFTVATVITTHAELRIVVAEVRRGTFSAAAYLLASSGLLGYRRAPRAGWRQWRRCDPEGGLPSQ